MRDALRVNTQFRKVVKAQYFAMLYVGAIQFVQFVGSIL